METIVDIRRDPNPTTVDQPEETSCWRQFGTISFESYLRFCTEGLEGIELELVS